MIDNKPSYNRTYEISMIMEKSNMTRRFDTEQPEFSFLGNYSANIRAVSIGAIVAEYMNEAENMGNNGGYDIVMPQREIHLHPDVRARLDRMHIRLRQNTCVICRQPTNEFIENGCQNNCGYYCHDLCAARWIVARLDNPRPYCMVCGVDHMINQIPRIMTDQSFIQATRERVEGGFLDLNNLGPQFQEYLIYRGIGVNQIDPHANEVMVELEAND